jgi:hypothetical protein
MRQEEEESSRGEVDQEGVLGLCMGKADKKGKKVQRKKPKEFYFNLLGGALYYYKQAEVLSPPAPLAFTPLLPCS